jgi:hypothetical protein
MKKKIIIIAIILLIVIFTAIFILNDQIIESLKDAFSIIEGISSIVVVIIAFMLYDKYGFEKTIKEKNLEVSLKLLEEIKKTTILIVGKDEFLQYRLTSFSIMVYEHRYKEKLLFSENYYDNLNPIFEFSNNLYLPNEIKLKLDKIIPYTMGKCTQTVNLDEYWKVVIKGDKSKEWLYNMINNQSDITVFDYLTNWDDLITTIQDWCSKNSDSKVDLNIKD